MSVQINSALFYSRAAAIFRSWQEDEGDSDGPWRGSSFLALLFGRTDDESRYGTTSAMFRWLLGFDFTDTLMLLEAKGAGKITFLASERKIVLLRQCLLTEEGGVPEQAASALDGTPACQVELLTRSKEDKDRANFERLTSRIKGDRGTVRLGGLWKEDVHGSFAAAFLSALKEEAEVVKCVNVASAFAMLLEVKDAREIKLIRSSCSITDVVFKRFLVPKIEEIVDEGQKVTHSKLGDTIEGYFREPRRISEKLQSAYVDSCYVPIVQSGKSFNMDLLAHENTKDVLDPSIIVCCVGTRYRSYCSNIGRTVLVNPTPEVDAHYKHLMGAFEAVLGALKAGVSSSKAYQAAEQYLRERDLARYLYNSVGHSMGIEFRERLQLTSHGEGTLRDGMILNVMVALTGIPRGDNKAPYALLIADTVLVTSVGHEVLTKYAKDALIYNFEEGDDADDPADALSPQQPLGKRKSRMRELATVLSGDAQRKKKQAELAKRLREEAERRAYSSAKSITAADEVAEVKDLTKVKTYASPSTYPSDALPARVVVDETAEALLLPVYGYMVPFHITMVKSVTRLEERLRIQFYAPGKSKYSAPVNEIRKKLPRTVFIKELTFEIKNAGTLQGVERAIKEMKKRVTMREKKRIEAKGIVDMPELVLARREKTPQLSGLYVKPSLGGKRVTGTLEAHKNGFRFTTVKGQKLDIIYSNIRFSFFQPAEKEAVIILHFHLFNPIMVGKKKTVDVQFFKELIEASTRLDARKRTYGDRDEILEEQRERQQRKKTNRLFHKFTKDVGAFAKRMARSDPTHDDDDEDEVVEFDIPFRELGFTGVPFKSNVLLQPSVQCLVHLVEGPPFFVLALQDIEVVSFERVSFSLKYFDLVFVLKDLSQDPVTINGIPIEALENIQDWLNKNDVKYYVGSQALAWPKIMETLREDPREFFLAGGWDFLETPESEEDEDEEDEEAASDDFEPEGDDEDEYDDEMDEDDLVDEDEVEEGSADEEDEDGEDWEALERKAAKADKKRWAK